MNSDTVCASTARRSGVAGHGARARGTGSVARRRRSLAAEYFMLTRCSVVDI